MASVFKSVGLSGVGPTLSTLYTAPTATTSTGIGLTIANVITSDITATVQLVKSGGDTFNVVKNAPVPVGSSLVIIGGDQKLVIQTGDMLKVVTSGIAAADVILSVLEQA